MSTSRRQFLERTAGLASMAMLRSPGVFAQRPLVNTATAIDIDGSRFFVSGRPTYPGRVFMGHPVEGLLFTSRMANCIIDDQNPQTRGVWAYPDGPWDPERNTREFVAALPLYRARGLTSVSFNIQGGSPVGYGWHQPWRTSGYAPDGHLLPGYRSRLVQVLDGLNDQGLIAILGLFYQAATPALADEAAIVRAVDEITDLICAGGYQNVLIEVANEADLPGWTHEILKPARAHELVKRIQIRSQGRLHTKAGRLLVSSSFVLPIDLPERFLRNADYILIHGNTLSTPEQMRARVRSIKASGAYLGQPILVNEDDHFDFSKADNNFIAALQEYCGWGYFDYRQIREGFVEGYQSLPVDWGISSSRKREFFGLLQKVTGAYQ
jgi:hypothetical protein